MAGLKISQLVDGASAQAGDELPVNRGGSNFKITCAYLLAYVQAGISISMAQVSGLAAALAGKSDVGHTHTEAEVTDLVADLAGKAALVHTHAEADITGLTADLAARQLGIQFQDEGTNRGAAGDVTTLNFTGAGVTATILSNTLTVNIPGGGSGGGSTVGTAIIDFGAFPGAAYTTIAVTGQAGIIAGSTVKAWIRPEDSADHNAMEHIVDPPDVFAADIVPGVGFTIHARTNNTRRHYGEFNCSWEWS